MDDKTLRILATLLLAFNRPSAFNGIGRVAHLPVKQHGPSIVNVKLLDVSTRLGHRSLWKLESARAAQSDLLMPDRILQAATSDRIQRVKDILTDKEIENVLVVCEFVVYLSADASQRIDFPIFEDRLKSCIDILKVRYGGQLDMSNALVERVLQTQKRLEVSKAQRMPTVKNTTVVEVPLSAQDVMNNLRRLNCNFTFREDGSVDWDETLASNRSSSGLGLELTKRLSGNEHGVAKRPTLIETKETKSLQNVSDRYRLRLQSLESEEETIKERVFQALDDGQSTTEDLATLRRIDIKIGELRKLATISRLNLDMERICIYLEQELSETSFDLAGVKLLVAEANLKEQQLAIVMKPVADEMKDFKQEEEDELATVLVDKDELSLITSGIDDLKSRLGIDGSRPPFDFGTMGRLPEKGLTFVKDTSVHIYWSLRVLVSDLIDTSKLIGKWFVLARRGEKLKPREVRTVWRFFKDALTVIPFTIIMAIPITPWGHVIVFRWISQNAPDLWPSCFSEKRLNLKRLVNSVSSDEDDLLTPRRGGIVLRQWVKIKIWLKRKILKMSAKVEGKMPWLRWMRMQLKQLRKSTAEDKKQWPKLAMFQFKDLALLQLKEIRQLRNFTVVGKIQWGF